jgi:PIN domain nuclease of toxin-antitoxin system
MNRDEIIRMAREADLWLTSPERIAAVERFAAIVAAKEREACVSIVEVYEIPVGNSAAGEIACEMTYGALKEIRESIRER